MYFIAPLNPYLYICLYIYLFIIHGTIWIKVKTIRQERRYVIPMNSTLKIKETVIEWSKLITISVGIALIIRTLFFAPYDVEGASMMPTLENEERLIVTKLDYFLHSPKRGDIVVFHATDDDDYVKRVIGVAGDTVKMDNDQLYINDEAVEEPYLTNFKQQINDRGNLTNDFGPITVPEGEIFVMGDNRRVSWDSRQIGTISLDKVVGRADIVLFPVHKIRLAN
jgi:signal peptidase I